MFGRSSARVIRAQSQAFRATMDAMQSPYSLYKGYRDRYIATGDPYQLQRMLEYVRLTDEEPR